jgi:WD40 repeat protein
MTGSDGQFSSPGPSIPFIISTAVEQIRSTMSANGAILAIREPAGLRWIAGAGRVPEAGAERQLASAFTQQCLHTGRVILCRDAQQDPLIHPGAAQMLNLRSAISVPIHFREVLIGVIQLFSSVPDAFNGTHIEALQEIGELIAPVLATEVAAETPETSQPPRSEDNPFPSGSEEAIFAAAAFADFVKPPSPAPPPVRQQSRFFLAPAETARMRTATQEPTVKEEVASPATIPSLLSPAPEASLPDPVFPVAAAAISSRFAKSRAAAPTTAPESSVGPPTPRVRALGQESSRFSEYFDRAWFVARAWLAAPMPPGFLRDVRRFVMQTTLGRTSLLAVCAAILVATLYVITHPAKSSPQLNPPSLVTPTSHIVPAKQPVHRGSSIEPAATESDSGLDKELPAPSKKRRDAASPKEKVAPSMPPISAPNSSRETQTPLQDISAKPYSSPPRIDASATLPLDPAANDSASITEAIRTSATAGESSMTSAGTATLTAFTPMVRSFDHSPPDFVLERTLRGHSNWVTGVAFTANGTHLASGSWDQTVKMWDVTTGLPVGTVSDDTQYVQALTSSRDGRYLAAENSRDTVTVWDIAANKAIHTFPTDRRVIANGNNWVYSIAFSPDNRLLASGMDDKTVRIWDVQSGQAVRDLTAGHRSVIYVAFSPDGRYIATGGTEKSIIIWDVANGEPVRKLTGHKKMVYTAAFSPDGRYLASASADKTVKIWDLQAGREIHNLIGHDGLVTTVTFSPDGRWLASGSWDKTIRIWDVESGAPLQTLTGNTRSIYSIAFDPQGRWIASGSEDGTIRLWRQHSTSALRN